MQYIESDDSIPLIDGLACSVDDGVCRLVWRWPNELQAVYIRRGSENAGNTGSSGYAENAGQSADTAGLRLYTREEYKANNGYRDRLDGIGVIEYTVYACVAVDGAPALVRQQDGRNRIAVSAGKAKIHYSIRYKSGWLHKYKTVVIRVTTEVPLESDVLCYVKKEGAYPANKDDGTVYPFVRPFEPGRTTLPEIEVGKRDYVRLFFTDGRRYGQIYELIPE